jgi:hypothetical protein
MDQLEYRPLDLAGKALATVVLIAVTAWYGVSAAQHDHYRIVASQPVGR